MGGIEPPMTVPRRCRGRIGSGSQSLLDFLDTEASDAFGETRQTFDFELEQTLLFYRRYGLLTFLLFELPAPLFQPTRIFFERQALLFQCLCHMGLLFNANRAMNRASITAVAARWKKVIEGSGRIGLAPDDGSIR